MKKLNDREITRHFLRTLISENTFPHDLFKKEKNCLHCGQCPCICVDLCGECKCDPCECEDLHNHDHDHSLENHDHEHLDADHNDLISKEELYNHFDLDNDGKVTPQEYADHIEFHCANPETLDHYKKREQDSIQHVPCKDSYQRCSQMFLADPEYMQGKIHAIMQSVGSTCPTSTAQAILDVLKSMKDCGLL